MNLENILHMIVNTYKYKIPHIYPNKGEKKTSLVYTSLKENKISLRNQHILVKTTIFIKGNILILDLDPSKLFTTKCQCIKLKM